MATRSSVLKERFLPDFPGSGFRDELNKDTDEEEQYQIWNSKFGGTRPEWLIFRELTRKKLKPGVDFEYQSTQMGGRIRLGGAIVDFILYNYIAGRVQGVYFHGNRESKTIDSIQRLMLEGNGFTVIDMWEDEIEAGPNRVAYLFIQGRETPRAQGRHG